MTARTRERRPLHRAGVPKSLTTTTYTPKDTLRSDPVADIFRDIQISHDEAWQRRLDRRVRDWLAGVPALTRPAWAR